MRERITIAFAVFILVLGIPYIGTLIINGLPSVKAKPASVQEIDSKRTVSVEVNNEYKVLDVEEYLLGVLPTVMEPTGDLEIWKAMAIIERTNIYRQMEGAGNIDAGDLYEEYLTKDEIIRLWGTRRYNRLIGTVERAIIETAGVAICYDGEYIEAYYHHVNSGTTVSAEELLGIPIPYLTSVTSGHDVESKDYMNIMYIDKSEIGNLEVTAMTEHGYVKSVKCDGLEMSAEEFCGSYHVPSYLFCVEEVEAEPDRHRIIALGMGHGMGLSVYGAKVLSSQGKEYEDILLYYYPGTQLTDGLQQTM